MEVRFVHVGLGHLVQAGRVLAVIKPNSCCGRRYSRSAKESGRFIDTTMGKGLKALLLLDDGSVMGSMITTKTLLKRLNGAEPSDEIVEDVEDVEEESEDH